MNTDAIPRLKRHQLQQPKSNRFSMQFKENPQIFFRNQLARVLPYTEKQNNKNNNMQDRVIPQYSIKIEERDYMHSMEFG